MKRHIRQGLRPALAVAVALAGLLAHSPTASAQGRPLAVSLSGGTDPARGDVDGSGWARLELNQGQEQICFEVQVRGTAPVSNVRIAEAESGRSILLLQNGMGSGMRCAAAGKDLVKAIRKEPGRYLLIVGTSQYPQGAVRGSLASASAEESLRMLMLAWSRAARGEVADRSGFALANLDWQGIDWRSIDWERMDWQGIDLAALGLEGVDLRSVDWKNVDWQGIDWERLDLRSVDLRAWLHAGQDAPRVDGGSGRDRAGNNRDDSNGNSRSDHNRSDNNRNDSSRGGNDNKQGGNDNNRGGND